MPLRFLWQKNQRPSAKGFVLVPGDGAQHSQGMQPRGHRGASLALWIGQQVRQGPNDSPETERLKAILNQPLTPSVNKGLHHVNQTNLDFFFEDSMLLCHGAYIVYLLGRWKRSAYQSCPVIPILHL